MNIFSFPIPLKRILNWYPFLRVYICFLRCECDLGQINFLCHGFLICKMGIKWYLVHSNHSVMVVVVLYYPSKVICSPQCSKDSLALLINVSSKNISKQNWNLFYEMQLLQFIFITRNSSLIIYSSKAQIYFEVN